MTEESLKLHKRHRREAIWSIIWNLIFLYIVNKVPEWDLPFINDRYDTVLWILNLSLILQILGWVLILFLDFRWLWHLVRAFLDGVSLVVLLVLYFLYPFDFSEIDTWSWIDFSETDAWSWIDIDMMLHIVFIIAIIAFGIGVIVHLFKLISSLRK